MVEKSLHSLFFTILGLLPEDTQRSLYFQGSLGALTISELIEVLKEDNISERDYSIHKSDDDFHIRLQHASYEYRVGIRSRDYNIMIRSGRPNDIGHYYVNISMRANIASAIKQLSDLFEARNK